jgi:hypothetical protein
MLVQLTRPTGVRQGGGGAAMMEALQHAAAADHSLRPGW